MSKNTEQKWYLSARRMTSFIYVCSLESCFILNDYFTANARCTICPPKKFNYYYIFNFLWISQTEKHLFSAAFEFYSSIFSPSKPGWTRDFVNAYIVRSNRDYEQ